MDNTEKLKVFISWSGKFSKTIAQLLYDYLPLMLPPGVYIFMSENNIQPGSRWSLQLSQELEKTNYGIICVTRDNLSNPWILFEAGALTKQLSGRACCLLLGDLEHSDIDGPLSQFHNYPFSKDSFKQIATSIHKELKSEENDTKIGYLIDGIWIKLEEEYLSVISDNNSGALISTFPPERDPQDILKEILISVRDIQKHFEPPKIEPIKDTDSLQGRWLYLLNDTINKMNVFGIVYIRHPLKKNPKNEFNQLNILTAEGRCWYFGEEPTDDNRRGDWFSRDVVYDIDRKRLVIIYDMKIKNGTPTENAEGTIKYLGTLDMIVRNLSGGDNAPDALTGRIYDIDTQTTKMGEVAAIRINDDYIDKDGLPLNLFKILKEMDYKVQSKDTNISISVNSLISYIGKLDAFTFTSHMVDTQQSDRI